MTGRTGGEQAVSTDPATPTTHGSPTAAGPGYAGEWALFCDYTTATGQPALPTTVDALTGFLHSLPARPTTVARRVRAIAAAHRRAGHLLARPATGPAAAAPPPGVRARFTDPGAVIAACPTRGWPHGLHGRRDAFLIAVTVSLAHPPASARDLGPAQLTVGAPPDRHPATTPDAGVVAIRGQVVPTGPDPRACPACAVARWLDILGTLDGLGRGSARMQLTAAHAPTPADPHRHHPHPPHRWRGAATLLPAIDQHGGLDDYQPITPRTIRIRLTHAAHRAALPAAEAETPEHPPWRPGDAPDPTAPGRLGTPRPAWTRYSPCSTPSPTTPKNSMTGSRPCSTGTAELGDRCRGRPSAPTLPECRRQGRPRRQSGTGSGSLERPVDAEHPMTVAGLAETSLHCSVRAGRYAARHDRSRPLSPRRACRGRCHRDLGHRARDQGDGGSAHRDAGRTRPRTRRDQTDSGRTRPGTGRDSASPRRALTNL